MNIIQSLPSREEPMQTRKLVTILGTAALLAGCGGGGGSGQSPSTSGTANTDQSARSNLTIKVDVGSEKTASYRRSPQQITTDVAKLIVNVDGTPQTLTLASNPPCSGSSPNYSCFVAVAAGAHTIYVATAKSDGTPVGYSVTQSVTVTSGQNVTANYTITPLAASFSGQTTTPSSGGSLPEDSGNHSVAATADVLSPNGTVISSPIDTLNLFGTVALSTTNSYSVTGPSQSAASATAGSYTDHDYTFTYDGAQIVGDQLAVTETYTTNATTGTVESLYNASPPSPAVIFSIPLVRLELPQSNNPGGATLNGSTFDGTSSWYYIAPSTGQANNGNSADVVFNGVTTADFTLNVTATNDSASPVEVTSTTPCASPVYTIGSTTGPSGGVYTTPITIHQPSSSGQTAACTLKVKDGTFSTLTQQVNIYPTTTTIGTLGIRRSH